MPFWEGRLSPASKRWWAQANERLHDEIEIGVIEPESQDVRMYPVDLGASRRYDAGPESEVLIG